MTLNGVMAVILCYFTEFGSFRAHSTKVVEEVNQLSTIRTRCPLCGAELLVVILICIISVRATIANHLIINVLCYCISISARLMRLRRQNIMQMVCYEMRKYSASETERLHAIKTVR